MGFAAKELEQTKYCVNAVKGGATRYVWGSEIWEEQETTLDGQRVMLTTLDVQLWQCLRDWRWEKIAFVILVI